MKLISQTKKLGNDGEQFVIDTLKKDGFTICAQNYRKFFGEIDIIAYKKNMYLFIEVKTRKTDSSLLGQLVSVSKQAKIIKTAQTFMSEQRKLCANNICRFDVALLVKNDANFTMQYIENAFTKSETDYGF